MSDDRGRRARTAGVAAVLGAAIAALISAKGGQIVDYFFPPLTDPPPFTPRECFDQLSTAEARCNERVGYCYQHCSRRRAEPASTLAAFGGPSCDTAAQALLVWIDLQCPPPRPVEPRGDKQDCRLWHHLSAPTTERLLATLEEACG